MPYIDPEIVARAREVDLLTYLQECDPEELVRIGGGTWCTKTHDSLKLSNGKWYWWSRGIGGRSALDYLMAVRGMEFTDAVREVLGPCADRAPAPPPAPRAAAPARPREFRPPPEAGTDAALRYLRRRGIASEVLDPLVREGIVYGSRRKGHQNVVFLGRDGDGRPRYAAVRSCVGSFKGEAAGSDKRHAFSVAQASPGPLDVHVFEGAIDALSFATLRHLAGDDWRSYSLLSLGGVPPVRADGSCAAPDALGTWLEEHSHCGEVHLHLDNDGAGRAASLAIAAALAGRVPVSIEPPAVGKDVNEWLLAAGRGSRDRACGGGPRGR